jgi:enoyl-CoA hydratase/carnithine racemase
MGISRDDIWKRAGSIGLLSLHSPRGNYLEEPGFIPLPLLEELFSEPGLKGVIIKGGGRHFSAGADLAQLKLLAKDDTLLAEKITAGKTLIRLIESLDVPVVAEISGVCFGGGLEIALACHIRICSDNALFAFPEVNYGIMPGLGGTVMLTRLIGPGRSAEMILSGDMANAEKALEMKLVEYIVPSVDLNSFTLEYLHKLTDDREVEVIRSVMKSIRNSLAMDMESALAEETRLFCALAVSNMNKA